uniref:Uncharacterized protein n=1 Tax=Arundo donax TaxID=35708 RepID=A0A0A8ZEZ6_ARUDO
MDRSRIPAKPSLSLQKMVVGEALSSIQSLQSGITRTNSS